MKIIYFIFLLVVIFSCNDNNSKNESGELSLDSASDTVVIAPERKAVSTELIEKIIDTLQNLELVDFAKIRIKTASMGSRNITFLPDSLVYPNGELYIAAGDNKPDRFETMINFYININTLTIRVYDVATDDTVDVKTYTTHYKTNL